MQCLKWRETSILSSLFNLEQNTCVVIYFMLIHLNLSFDLVTS